MQSTRTRELDFNLEFDACVAASWDFGGFLLIEIDQLATRRLRDSTLVTERRVGHATTEAKSLNHS